MQMMNGVLLDFGQLVIQSVKIQVVGGIMKCRFVAVLELLFFVWLLINHKTNTVLMLSMLLTLLIVPSSQMVDFMDCFFHPMNAL